MESEWSDEILVSVANVTAYRLIYEAENWLRRIALASLLLTEGPAWATKIDSSLRGRLEAQSRLNSSRWILGIDAEEELLWSATLGQLADVLTTKAIDERVNRLSGTSGSVLASRIRSIADVRNALAHNRAISTDTLAVLNGDLVVVRAAARRFKANTLYAKSDIVSDSAPADLASLARAFNSTTDALHGQQLFMSANDDFVFFVRLPVGPFGTWPGVEKLRDVLGLTAHLLLCVLVNKQGDELELVMPRTLADAERLEVLDRFSTIASTRDLWTDQPPDEQHAADASWPRVWYYENQPQLNR